MSGEVTKEDAARTVHATPDAGINLIDTSPFNGDTKSENMPARRLKGMDRRR